MIRRAATWLTRPVGYSTESLGLFRIAYSAFYLWHLSFVEAGLLGAAPDANWEPTSLYTNLLVRPPAWLPGVAESVLAGLLILLLVGLRTRWVSVLVFVVGFLLDGFVQSLGKVEHATVFLTFYIPLFMSCSSWGERYSLDSRRTVSDAPGSTLGDGTRGLWPARALLIVLAFLFLTAGWSKVLGGHWSSNPDIVADLIARAYYRSVLDGLAPNPFAEVILHSTTAQGLLRLGVPLFECLFVMVLVGPAIRRVYVALAVVFHASNALFLGVTFTPILIAYGVVVDWRRVVPAAWLASASEGVRKWPTPYIAVVGSVVAVAVAIDWNLVGVVRLGINLGGMLNWLTIWYVAGPIAIVRILDLAIRSTVPLLRLPAGD